MKNISLVRGIGFLPVREINAVTIGMDADVKVDALSDMSFVGKVSVVNPRIDPVIRTFMVKMEIPSEDFVLKEKRKLQRLIKGLKGLDAEVGDKGLFAFRWPVERIV